MDEGKYYMKRAKYDSHTFNFVPSNYYLAIDGGEISKNPLLIQNPGY
jgi:hypothetical protein